MSNTLKINDSINYAQAFSGFKPLNIGVGGEPAITAANIVLQTIIGPPFTWNWNRSSVSFLTTLGTQDYTRNVPTFGFIEKADYIPGAQVTATSLTANVATYTAVNSFVVGAKVTVTGSTNDPAFNVVNAVIVTASATQFTVAITHANIPSANDQAIAVSGDLKEVPNVVNVLGSGNELGTPNNIAPQVDDNAGNITFRVLPVPDAVYLVTVIFQKRIPALITSVGDKWTPIPDHYSYIFQAGFAALMMAYTGDTRWGSFNQKFVGGLLGAAEGLSEVHKNIFQEAWLSSITEMQATGLRAQQGMSARGV